MWIFSFFRLSLHYIVYMKVIIGKIYFFSLASVFSVCCCPLSADDQRRARFTCAPSSRQPPLHFSSGSIRPCVVLRRGSGSRWLRMSAPCPRERCVRRRSGRAGPRDSHQIAALPLSWPPPTPPRGGQPGTLCARKFVSYMALTTSWCAFLQHGILQGEFSNNSQIFEIHVISANACFCLAFFVLIISTE